MVSSIQCYLDGAGGLHRTAIEAHQADVKQWLQATGAVNEASAGQLAERIVTDRETLFELVSMLEAVARDVPAPVGAAA